MGHSRGEVSPPIPVQLQYANGRAQLPFSSSNLAVSSGGSTTIAHSLYFTLQGQNVAGYNLPSSIVGPIAIAAGEQLTITLPTTIQNSGEYFSHYILSASATNDPATFVQLATISAFDSLGAPVSLPTSLTLNTDEHFKLSAIVANPAALPTASLVPGLRRGVSSLAAVFEYNPASLLDVNGTTALDAAPAPGRWLRVGGFSTVVTDITDPGGCRQDARDPDVVINVSGYPCDGSNGPGFRFWLMNDDISPIPSGQRVVIGVTLDEVPRSGLFEGLLRCIFRGFVSTSTGVIRTTTGTGEDMSGVGNEIIFENKKTDLILEDDLNPGEAYVIEIYPHFRADQLNNQILNQSLLKVNVALALQAGAFVEGGSAWGDRIYPDYDRGLVVPQRVAARCLKRSGMVNSRSFLAIASTPVLGAVQNTDDQPLYISSNGVAYFKPSTEPKLDTEAIRAKISTLAGVSDPSPWSAPLTVTSGNAIDITCTYPSNGTTATIRANYPDPLLIGNSQGQLNAQLVTLYVRSTVSSVATIKAFPGRLLVDGATQTFAISDWNAGTTISVVPVAPTADFSLFEAVSATALVAGIGNIPAGTIEAAFAYEYDGSQITSISHRSIDGCIHTSTLTLAEVEETSQYWATAVSTIAELRAVPAAQIIGYQSRYVAEVNRVYHYDPSSIATDDGRIILKPTGKLITDPGRWFIEEFSKIYSGTTEPDADLGLRSDVYLRADAVTSSLKVYGKSTVWTLTGTITAPTGPQGATGPQGPIGLTGPQGPIGPTGAVTSASALILNPIAASGITTDSDEYAFFVDSADSKFKSKAPSNGAVTEVGSGGDGSGGGLATVQSGKPTTIPAQSGLIVADDRTGTVGDGTTTRGTLWVATNANSAADWKPFGWRPVFVDVDKTSSAAEGGGGISQEFLALIPSDFIGQTLIVRQSTPTYSGGGVLLYTDYDLTYFVALFRDSPNPWYNIFYDFYRG